MIVLLAPTVELARCVKADVTIEAEYGAEVIEGRRYTAAHHQPPGSPYAGNHVGGSRSAPCNDGMLSLLEGPVETVLLSHIDLDSIGGALRCLPEFADLFDVETGLDRWRFWALAEWVDVRGPHKLGQAPTRIEEVERLRAFWAWSKANIPRFGTDAITVVTPYMRAAGEALRRIFAGDAELLAAGAAVAAAEADLNARTFHGVYGPSGARGGVIVRYTRGAFVNHLYTTPGGTVCRAVAKYDEDTGVITISLAETTPGVSCRTLLQGLFGDKAGGHDNIAESPRGARMTYDDFNRAVGALDLALAPE